MDPQRLFKKTNVGACFKYNSDTLSVIPEADRVAENMKTEEMISSKQVAASWKGNSHTYSFILLN